jgi:hypothetical protein
MLVCPFLLTEVIIMLELHEFFTSRLGIAILIIVGATAWLSYQNYLDHKG